MRNWIEKKVAVLVGMRMGGVSPLITSPAIYALTFLALFTRKTS